MFWLVLEGSKLRKLGVSVAMLPLEPLFHGSIHLIDWNVLEQVRIFGLSPFILCSCLSLIKDIFALRIGNV